MSVLAPLGITAIERPSGRSPADQGLPRRAHFGCVSRVEHIPPISRRMWRHLEALAHLGGVTNPSIDSALVQLRRWELALPAAPARGDQGNRRLHARWDSFTARRKRIAIGTGALPCHLTRGHSTSADAERGRDRGDGMPVRTDAAARLPAGTLGQRRPGSDVLAGLGPRRHGAGLLISWQRQTR